MSTTRGNGQNGGNFYSNITQPVKVDLAWTVTPTNGLGVTSVKSNGYVRNVFMHTSTTPASNNGMTNPNPANGYALIQFNNNYKVYLGETTSIMSPTSGSALTSTTAGNPYTISALGTTTLAQWQAAGLQAGLTPTIGQSFIAIATGAIGGTGTVLAPGYSGIDAVEVIGDPNQSISNSGISVNGGALLLVQFIASTSSSVTTPLATAPAAGTVVTMSTYFDISSSTIDGL